MKVKKPRPAAPLTSEYRIFQESDMKKKSLLHRILWICVCLATVLMFSCIFSPEDGDGDDPAGGGSANGVYAKLIVARITVESTPTPYTTDSIEAIFSGNYDPCAIVSDLQPTSVECDDSSENYILVYENDKYIYDQDPPDADFLILGNTYDFTVTASSEVPDLTADIILPSAEPTITNPGFGDGVSPSSDLTITWNSTGSGTVIIIMMNTGTSEVVISDETEDDGSYTIGSSTLSGFSTGDYYLQIERYSEETITATGYDDRSIIRGRLMSMVYFSLTS